MRARRGEKVGRKGRENKIEREPDEREKQGWKGIEGRKEGQFGDNGRDRDGRDWGK